MARKSVPKDVGNDKALVGGLLATSLEHTNVDGFFQFEAIELIGSIINVEAG